MQRVKQVIIIRKDLKMRRGKEISQGSHASAEFLVDQVRRGLQTGAKSVVTVNVSPQEREWLLGGMAKVCLRVNSEEELLLHHEKAKEQGLTSHLIQDSGRTEFGGVPTFTACAIGPDEADKIDAVTGELIPY